MQKTDISQSCNATLSAIGHEYEENEYEDSDVDWTLNAYNARNNHSDDGGSSYSEDSEESELDGDELEEPWIPSDEDDDGNQDLDLYEADNENQDTDMDSDEEDHQDTNSRGDQHKISNLKPDKESSQETPLNEDKLNNHTPTSAQVLESNPSPTPEPHHETIALGQHHLWMM